MTVKKKSLSKAIIPQRETFSYNLLAFYGTLNVSPMV